jgi:hypothetical protein
VKGENKDERFSFCFLIKIKNKNDWSVLILVAAVDRIAFVHCSHLFWQS